MISILRLVRFPNLVMIALTMILVRYGILQPLFVVNALSLEFPDQYFMFLVISVMLIAAAGYMINDYFDVDTDTINNPDKVIIGKRFTATSVYYSYLVLNCIALVLAFYITYKTTILSLFFIFPITAGILWFYSTTYKRQLLLGNLLISVLIGIVPLLPAVYEIPLVFIKYKSFIQNTEMNIQFIYVWVGIFGIFAFLINFIREIVKDAEDYIGDKVTGCQTLPVVFGLKVTKVVVIVLLILVIFLLAGLFIFFLLFNEYGKIDYITLGYFLVFLITPMIITMIYIYKAEKKKFYTKAALVLKVVLFFGIFYAWILRYKIL